MFSRSLIALALCLAACAAFAQPGPPGPSRFVRLYSAFPTSSNGNGADTTEDTIAPCSYTIPAGQLANVGDTLRIKIWGAFAASTDVKTVRAKLAGTAMQAIAGSAAGQTGWVIELEIAKTGTNTQSQWRWGATNNASVQTLPNVTAITDTATIAFTVTGQNATNSVANSITCNWLTVDFVR